MIRLGFLLRGYFKGVCKGPIVGFYNVGVLIIRVGLGLGGYISTKSTPNSTSFGNCFGPHGNNPNRGLGYMTMRGYYC